MRNGAFFVCVVLLLIAFRQAEADLLTAWGTDEYSHGPFIPFIGLMLGWHFLAERRPVIRPSWWGVAFLAVAAMLQAISRLSAFGMAEQYGLVIAIIGLVLAFWDVRAVRVLAPALIYLFFAVPLPHLVQADLSQDMQLLSSTLGVWPLDMLGIPVFQEGNVIDLGGYRLQVVEACSGLRYLFPLMSFGYLVAVMMQDKMWKRVAIFLSTIPIAILLNALRIALIGITVDQWGQKMAEGFIHSFEGWAVFLACLAVLAGEAWVLLRVGQPRGRFRFDYIGPAHGSLFAHKVKDVSAPVIASIILLAAIVASTFISPPKEIIPAHTPLAAFPIQSGDWQGKQGRLAPDVLASLQLSDYWLADYVRTNDSEPVDLYIAYYDSQRVGTTTHSPSNCIPGGGWRIEQRQTVPVQLANGARLDVTRLIIRRDHVAQLVYYWFDERGRDLTETVAAKWYLLRDSMIMRRSDGALVRLTTPMGADEGEADKRLQAFLGQFYPVFPNFIPGTQPPHVTLP